MNKKEYEAKCCMYDILMEVDRICKKNNIKYTLAYGTLLGAIRHKGFIPWDDDIDIAFLRSEYEKFLKCCETDLSDEYRIVNAETENGNPNIFHKIKIKGTTYIENISKNNVEYKEIFLDILPIDNSPRNRLVAYLHNVKVFLYYRLLSLKCGNDFSSTKNGLKRVFNNVLLAFSKFYSKDKLIAKLKRMITKYNNRETGYVYCAFDGINLVSRFEKKLFLNYTTKKFEDDSFSVIKDYDICLKSIYGNYKELPPVDKRTSEHQILMINLGKYKIKNHLKKGGTL